MPWDKSTAQASKDMLHTVITAEPHLNGSNGNLGEERRKRGLFPRCYLLGTDFRRPREECTYCNVVCNTPGLVPITLILGLQVRKMPPLRFSLY